VAASFYQDSVWALFVTRRKRISYSYVLTMAVRAASATLFLFPIMLSLTRVEAEEDELLSNGTACVAACTENK
jgi:hypothetical protein